MRAGISFCRKEELLLQAFLNSNSHGNGHTDHGVVTCAQEAHHLNVKSACRRLCACGARVLHILFQCGKHVIRKPEQVRLIEINPYMVRIAVQALEQITTISAVP